MNLINCFRVLGSIILAGLLSGCGENNQPMLQIGETAPPFTLELVNGEQSRLDLYSGKALVITFMSSWCPCSNDTIPLVKQTYLDHKDDNIVFLLIGIQDSRSKFENFVKKWEVPFPAGYDEDDHIASAYGISAPPTTIFIDKNGVVKRAFYGNIARDKKDEFPGWIKEIL